MEAKLLLLLTFLAIHTLLTSAGKYLFISDNQKQSFDGFQWNFQKTCKKQPTMVLFF